MYDHQYWWLLYDSDYSDYDLRVFELRVLSYRV
jgi:hypothetical protein